MQQYALPDLAYDYDALEPYYSGEMLELHHDKHHAAYVAGANATLDTIEAARHAGDAARRSRPPYPGLRIGNERADRQRHDAVGDEHGEAGDRGRNEFAVELAHLHSPASSDSSPVTSA